MLQEIYRTDLKKEIHSVIHGSSKYLSSSTTQKVLVKYEAIKLNETTVLSKTSEINGPEMAIWETFSRRPVASRDS